MPSRPKIGSPPSQSLRPKRLPGLSVRDGYTQHPFDLEFGVRTSGLIAGRDLTTGHIHDRHNTAYYGVAPSVFQSLIRRWQRSKPVAPIEEFTFVDLGAGMGRAMLLASKFPFREVVGVELHPALVRTAKKNLTVWRAGGRGLAPLRIQMEDAAQFIFPPNPTLVFLFNPFGATVLRRVMSGVATQFATRPNQLDLIYVNCEQESVLATNPGLKRIFMGSIARSRADAIADHTILANQRDGEYASSNHEDCSIHRWIGKLARFRP